MNSGFGSGKLDPGKCTMSPQISSRSLSPSSNRAVCPGVSPGSVARLVWYNFPARYRSNPLRIRVKNRGRDCEILPLAFAETTERHLVTPEIEIVAMDDDLRISEDRRARKVDEPRRVVAVEMGHQHRIDVGWRDAKRAQSLYLPARAGRCRAAARINQDQASRSLDRKRVAGEPGGVFPELRPMRGLPDFWFDADHILERSAQHSVVNRRNPELAKVSAVEFREPAQPEETSPFV